MGREGRDSERVDREEIIVSGSVASSWCVRDRERQGVERGVTVSAVASCCVRLRTQWVAYENLIRNTT